MPSDCQVCLNTAATSIDVVSCSIFWAFAKCYFPSSNLTILAQGYYASPSYYHLPGTGDHWGGAYIATRRPYALLCIQQHCFVSFIQCVSLALRLQYSQLNRQAHSKGQVQKKLWLQVSSSTRTIAFGILVIGYCGQLSIHRCL